MSELGGAEGQSNLFCSAQGAMLAAPLLSACSSEASMTSEMLSPAQLSAKLACAVTQPCMTPCKWPLLTLAAVQCLGSSDSETQFGGPQSKLTVANTTTGAPSPAPKSCAPAEACSLPEAVQATLNISVSAT